MTVHEMVWGGVKGAKQAINKRAQCSLSAVTVQYKKPFSSLFKKMLNCYVVKGQLFHFEVLLLRYISE